MTPPKAFTTYSEFWPYYLAQHSQRGTRVWHAVGLICGLLTFGLGIYRNNYWLIPASLLVGYVFAWTSHWRVEKNRPATFGHPFWSFISEFRMTFLVLTGRL